MSEKIYSLITDKILEALEKGVVPWRKTWRGGSENAPCAYKSKKPYRGINVFLLGCMQQSAGYSSNLWITFKQAKDLKGSVRKGEKGTPVIFWKLLRKESADPDTGKIKKDTIPLLRYYTVFNLDQCDGIKDPNAASKPEGIVFNPIESCNALVEAYVNNDNAPRLTLQHEEQRAYYNPSKDLVNMPKCETFESVEAYYSTLFHELTHSTGHKNRLDRPGLKDPCFGTETYSKEELIAEMGAAMLCGITGIENNALIDNAASYIAHWKGKLKDDPKLLICAAAAAQKSCDKIRGITFSDKAKDEDEEE